MHGEVTGDPLETLKKNKIVLSKVLKKKKIYKKLHDYLFVKKSQFASFYLLLKIQTRMKNISGTPVISNSVITTERISAYLDYNGQH